VLDKLQTWVHRHPETQACNRRPHSLYLLSISLHQVATTLQLVRADYDWERCVFGRFADFLVNEIDVDGAPVHLTSLDAISTNEKSRSAAAAKDEGAADAPHDCGSPSGASHAVCPCRAVSRSGTLHCNAAQNWQVLDGLLCHLLLQLNFHVACAAVHAAQKRVARCHGYVVVPDPCSRFIL
jgi:hypothetical protein